MKLGFNREDVNFLLMLCVHSFRFLIFFFKYGERWDIRIEKSSTRDNGVPGSFL